MATTPEGKFSARVREGLQSLPGCYVTRIESRVGLGTPDMLLAFGGTGSFVMLELKAITRGLQVKLSPHQVAFMIKHASLGCPVYVMVQHKREGARYGDVLLYHGRDAIKLVENGIRENPIAQWPTNKIEWSTLGFILMHGSMP